MSTGEKLGYRPFISNSLVGVWLVNGIIEPIIPDRRREVLRERWRIGIGRVDDALGWLTLLAVGAYLSAELAAVSQDGVVSVINPKSGEIIDSYKRDMAIWMRPTPADLDDDGGHEILVVYGDVRVVALSFDKG